MNDNSKRKCIRCGKNLSLSEFPKSIVCIRHVCKKCVCNDAKASKLRRRQAFLKEERKKHKGEKKVCARCGLLINITDYYIRHSLPDGHLHICSFCIKKEKNKDKIYPVPEIKKEVIKEEVAFIDIDKENDIEKIANFYKTSKENLKQCEACLRYKPRTIRYFSRRRGTLDGLFEICIACSNNSNRRAVWYNRKAGLY
jgi:hypothetical protein